MTIKYHPALRPWRKFWQFQLHVSCLCGSEPGLLTRAISCATSGASTAWLCYDVISPLRLLVVLFPAEPSVAYPAAGQKSCPPYPRYSAHGTIRTLIDTRPARNTECKGTYRPAGGRRMPPTIISNNVRSVSRPNIHHLLWPLYRFRDNKVRGDSGFF